MSYLNFKEVKSIPINAGDFVFQSIIFQRHEFQGLKTFPSKHIQNIMPVIYFNRFLRALMNALFDKVSSAFESSPKHCILLPCRVWKKQRKNWFYSTKFS